MLEFIGAGVESKQTNEMDYFQGVSELSHSAKRIASNGVQCKYVLQRFLRICWHTPSCNYTRIMLAIFLAVLFGLCYRSIDYTTYSGVTGGVGLIFLTVVSA
ncbi:hypothetical protein LEN26_020608 [Aphanomyces euteiches]|nr:hypothetical protein LEN26_020608 [Aphanomyces euteiches]KAH9124081.1 hypothetical protein AeMF1_005097 [Aphanomyces euteiches]